MLTKQQIDAFERDGFLNAGRVLADDEVERLSDELDRIIDKGPDGFGPHEPRLILFRDLNNLDQTSGPTRKRRVG